MIEPILELASTELSAQLQIVPTCLSTDAEDAADNLAYQRLLVLTLAQELRSVSEACRQVGMSRVSFYKWKRRFRAYGMPGLKNLLPVAKEHPFTTSKEMVDKVLTLSGTYPEWGCKRLSKHLEQKEATVSSVTIQGILNRHGLGSRYERLLKKEEWACQEKIELTIEQAHQIEKINPTYKERYSESRQPGELLCQDVFQVGYLKGTGKVFLHIVVDTYSSYAFGFLHTCKKPEATATAMYYVLPFYRELGIPVTEVMTDNGQEFCGTTASSYRTFIGGCKIRHTRVNVASSKFSGFIERFRRTVCDEFFRQAFHTKLYASVTDLQAALDSWLLYYNWERPHQGYRNFGKKPIDAMNNYLKGIDREDLVLNLHKNKLRVIDDVNTHTIQTNYFRGAELIGVVDTANHCEDLVLSMTDEDYAMVTPILPELSRRPDRRGRPWNDQRHILDAILYALLANVAWRALPNHFPSSQTCHRWYFRWVSGKILARIIRVLGAKSSGSLARQCYQFRNPSPGRYSTNYGLTYRSWKLYKQRYKVIFGKDIDAPP